MPSSMIALCSLVLGVLYVADARIFGFQAGNDPFKLTVLCPENGTTCLFNLPGLRQQFRTIKVDSNCHQEGSLFSFILEWDDDAHQTYVAAVCGHGIFDSMQEDGFSYIDFDMDSGNALVDMGLSEGDHDTVPQLDDQEAERLCQQLGCL